ncbi:MAG TPA: hypothetical protein VGC06_08085 [Actinomycetes bacterium]
MRAIWPPGRGWQPPRRRRLQVRAAEMASVLRELPAAGRLVFSG